MSPLPKFSKLPKLSKLPSLPRVPAFPPLPPLPPQLSLPGWARRPAILGALVAVWVAAGWVWAGLVAPQIVPAGEPLPMQRVGGPSASSPPLPPPLAQSLGAQAGQTVMPRPEEIRLVGLLAGVDEGSITLSIQNGPVRTLRQGQTAPDGWRFEGIRQGRALLSRYGQTVEVPVPRTSPGLTPASPAQP